MKGGREGGREGEKEREYYQVFLCPSTVQPQILLLDYLLLFSSKSCVFEDLRMFVDSFPDEAVGVALQHFEEMVASDSVNFDCQDIDIKENVSTHFMKVWYAQVSC